MKEVLETKQNSGMCILGILLEKVHKEWLRTQFGNHFDTIFNEAVTKKSFVSYDHNREPEFDLPDDSILIETRDPNEFCRYIGELLVVEFKSDLKIETDIKILSGVEDYENRKLSFIEKLGKLIPQTEEEFRLLGEITSLAREVL
ncbi:hypothetical protein ND856_18585 [Leptospira bandrabouensis]|uniref:hypothetical protein n=1 Tax=Leptospira bandrabouensis TaxID=2484903 RepID=UPI00223E13AD|nr:hypothetical protein [Leptospira bandrabouensis]MCW7460169.1 hypothetical protein [Leptospira bandrabouensis]MCW7479314.1 hypothetical protein [Leptospira bandrabouensis]MCW7486996.1 hypothetical protein [Leptospira bandrabouensis]